ncbi:uncharacterized protein LOC124925344 [Impatiens glandulifera]|uniref:uncharacterized protein LOC124925344 n=1 Tax=Impatiens glandulifera TaxID=253017 RepID=UPI001FB11F10|nr:uncharacterized protein LOC124925344 [Impatiens glandulifera]
MVVQSSNVGTPKLLSKNGSLQQERQISVDPISIKESVFKKSHNNPSFLLPHLKPGKFLSASLPGSATSSPRFSSPMKKWKNQSPTQQPSSIDPITGQQSLALSRLAQLQEIHLQRSKSCSEGRNTSSSIDLEMCTRKLKTQYLKEISSFNKKSHDDVQSIDQVNRRKGGIEGDGEGKYNEKFKCGACLFLPGFGKAKPVRSHRIEEEYNDDDDNIGITTMRKPMSNEKKQVMADNMISKRVSLEKFECASWTTSVVVLDAYDDMVDGDSLFFDLPMELIRNDSRDNESPVATAFVFDGDLKGVLKKAVVEGSGMDNRKSVESGSRHVRFSDASPTTDSRPQG